MFCKYLPYRDRDSYSAHHRLRYSPLYRDWSERTHKFFMDLWQRGLAADVGLALLPMMRLTSESKYEDADWMHIPYGGSRMSDRQLERVSAEFQKRFT